MGILARASAAEIEARLADAPALPPHTRLRGPETAKRGEARDDSYPTFLEDTMASTVIPSMKLVGYQARASDGTVIGEIAGAGPNGMRIHKALTAVAVIPSLHCSPV